MYLIAFPLLLIPFALYNMAAFLLGLPFDHTVFSIPLMADGQLPVTVGDSLVGLGILLLYLEVLKAARLAGKAAMDHVLSFLLLVAMTSELLLVPRAATATLLLLAVLSFVDVITGISVAGHAKQREIMIEGADRTPSVS